MIQIERHKLRHSFCLFYIQCMPWQFLLRVTFHRKIVHYLQESVNNKTTINQRFLLKKRLT